MTGQMSFSLFSTIDRDKKEQSSGQRNSALSTVVRVGARVALQQRSILRTNNPSLSRKMGLVPFP